MLCRLTPWHRQIDLEKSGNKMTSEAETLVDPGSTVRKRPSSVSRKLIPTEIP